MTLVTLKQAAEIHSIKYMTLVDRLKRNYVEARGRIGKALLYDYEDLKQCILFPVNQALLEKKRLAKERGDFSLRQAKTIDSPIYYASIDDFWQMQRDVHANTILRGLSIYD